MKKAIIIIILILVGNIEISYSQQKNSDQPDERIEVNREYDERGNLIRYDSIYSYSSSNSSMSSREMDSIFATFFSGNRSSFFESPFEMDFPFQNRFLAMDSIIKKRFQSRSFFDHFFEEQQPKKDTVYLKKDN